MFAKRAAHHASTVGMIESTIQCWFQLKVLQALDLETYITKQMQDSEEKTLSENDMTWKMI